MINNNQRFFPFRLTDSDSLSSIDMQPPTKRAEIFCNNQEQDKFLPDDGVESSVLLDLKPGKTMNSCKRFFTAPLSSGLFIRLIKSDTENETLHGLTTFRGNIHNTTEYCPISIVSINRPTLTLPLKRSAKRLNHPHACLNFLLCLISSSSSQ